MEDAQGALRPAPDLSHPTYGTWFDKTHAAAVRTTPIDRNLQHVSLLSGIDAVLFDLDGTLARPRMGTKGDHQGFPITPDDRMLIPGTLEMAASILQRGIPLGIATNQGGVAFGRGTPESVMDVVIVLAKEIGVSVATACWSHPKASTLPARYRVPEGADEWRKPRPGMLQWLMFTLQTLPKHTLYIGNSQEDHEAACNVPGLQYCNIDMFRRALIESSEFDPFPDPDTDPEGWLARFNEVNGAQEAEGSDEDDPGRTRPVATLTAARQRRDTVRLSRRRGIGW